MSGKDNVPYRIESKIKNYEPNQVIEIYRGEVVMEMDEITVTLQNARVFFSWYPKLGMFISACDQNLNAEESRLISTSESFKVKIDGNTLGKGYISALTISGSHSLTIRMIDQVIMGDASISCTEIFFSIPNLKAFLGDRIKIETNRGISYYGGRVALDDGEFRVILDKAIDMSEMERKSEVSEGHILTYDGLLKRVNGKPISHSDVDQLMPRLAKFLSFINGYEIYPLIIYGIHDEEIKWIDYSAREIQSFQYVKSWSVSSSVDGFSELWLNFSKFWKDENNQDVFNNAINLYNQINRKDQYIESSIVIGQTVLELLYNWWVVETRKGILDKDAESISASNKIRLLLSFTGYEDYSAPDSFTYLQDLIEESRELKDAIEAVVYIRNSIVHSQERKRRELKRIAHRARIEALDLIIWYVEYALLHFLQFKGKVRRRIDGRHYIN